MLGEGMEDERMFEFFGQRNLLPAFCQMVRLEETGEGGREGGREEGQEGGRRKTHGEGCEMGHWPMFEECRVDIYVVF